MNVLGTIENWNNIYDLTCKILFTHFFIMFYLYSVFNMVPIKSLQYNLHLALSVLFPFIKLSAVCVVYDILGNHPLIPSFLYQFISFKEKTYESSFSHPTVPINHKLLIYVKFYEIYLCSTLI